MNEWSLSMIVVIGAGHAGCGRRRKSGLKDLSYHNGHEDGQMSCNPANGGIAKGQIVREIERFRRIYGLLPIKQLSSSRY